MFVPFTQLRQHLHQVITNKSDQGHVVVGLAKRLDALPDSYDRLLEFAYVLAELPLRDD